MANHNSRRWTYTSRSSHLTEQLLIFNIVNAFQSQPAALVLLEVGNHDLCPSILTIYVWMEVAALITSTENEGS